MSDASTLIAGDTNAQTDVFVKNVGTGGIQRVSRQASKLESPQPSALPFMSRDGKYVLFWSYGALSSQDADNDWDTYRTNIPLSV